MADPSGPDAESTSESAEQPPPEGEAADTQADTQPDAPTGSDATTEVLTVEQEPDAAPEAAEPTAEEGDSAAATEVIQTPTEAPPQQAPARPERRFTAPSGFDAGATEKIDTPPEPTTEVIATAGAPTAPVNQSAINPTLMPPKSAAPQAIPPRPLRRQRSWGWVLALILVIAALAAVAIFGTVWLTRNASPKISQEDLVRTTIMNFDTAIQKGDLATLRSITCGTTRDNYVKYDDRAWAATHARVAAAKQYPEIASIDQVVVNGEHAEANVTTFMAYDPQIRSTRSFDLQFRDDQWKICQAPGG
jgi:hypothetical protein